MAKAKAITGLDCQANASEWAAEVLRVRFEEMVDWRAAALDFSDIEGVHSMRVASRRLRSALRDFLPILDERPFRRVKKELKSIADALGAVRDEDVAIAALDELVPPAPTGAIRDGLARLIDERRERRAAARLDLAEAVAVDRLANARERFFKAIEKASNGKKTDRTVSFNAAGRAAVAAGLDELIELGRGLYDPFDTDAHHEMRIAAKRLRYALELFVACWGEALEPFADEVADLQSALGEVHDCDVWIEGLTKRLTAAAKGKRFGADDRDAAAWLLLRFVRERTRQYRASLKIWNRWTTEDFAANMKAAVQSDGR